MKHLFFLEVDAPQSLADTVLDLMPETTYGQTAFKREAEDRADDPLWTVQSLYRKLPDTGALSVALHILATAHGLSNFQLRTGQVQADGWLKKSEDDYPPIRAGRLCIQGPHQNAAAPHEKAIAMPVGAAFGTGKHETTFGCLMALQIPGTLRRGMRVLDIGSGSGILALAAAKLKPVRVVGGEMDFESVLVARGNIRANGLRARMRMEKAMGFNHAAIKRCAPYNLILSNIFARPLARLAPAMRKHLAPGGEVVLAGFLQRDARMVQNAYAAQRIHLKKRLTYGAWVILALKRPIRATTLLTKSR